MKRKLKKKCKNCGKTFITFDESVEFCNLGCREDYANPPIAIPESKRAKKITEQKKKKIITKINSLTFALNDVKCAIMHITNCCAVCGECDKLKMGCRVAQSYRKLTIMRQLLSEEIDELENPR